MRRTEEVTTAAGLRERPNGGGAGGTLVERFDIEPYSDFSAKLSNFRGLVLFCIDAKFCNKIFVGISYLFEKKIEKRDMGRD